MKMKCIKHNFLLFGLFLIVAISCSKGTDNTAPNLDFSNEIENITYNVIMETYQTLIEKTNILKKEVGNLTKGDSVTLERSRQAWRDSRKPWEQSEGFLYGPVDLEGIDPAVDSWPLDISFVNSILSGSERITSDFLASQNNNAKGFHTIEYLLWGVNGTKKAKEFTIREIEYLRAASDRLHQNFVKLYNGWHQEGGNFSGQFVNIPSRSYKSQANVLQEIVDGLIIIADEVANGKIETPLNGNNGQAAPLQEESRFSDNSKADFVHNIQSIRNIYFGDYKGKEGLGLSDILKAQKEIELNEKVSQSIGEAEQAIKNIPGAFSEAIQSHRTEVQKAQNKVNTLFKLLDQRVKAFIHKLR